MLENPVPTTPFPAVAFKRYYTFIFSFFYVIQGFVQGLSQVYAIYILDVFGDYDIALVLFIYSVSTLPWTVKFVIGFFNDKWGSKKYGRRFPFIMSFGIFGGIFCILMALFIPSEEAVIYTYFLIFTIFINIGMSFADTALDGLILDVTPKERLGKMQGWTWSMLLLGSGIGLGVVLIWGQFQRPKDFFPLMFIIVGIMLWLACTLTFMVEEPPLKENIQLGLEVKKIFNKPRNYSVFAYTFVAAIAPIMVLAIYNYLILISIGVIDVEATRLSLIEGDSIDLLEWQAVFLVVNGVGIVLGSLIAGRLADKKRRLAVYVAYAVFIPFCLISNLFVGLILGMMGQVIFGIAEGSRSISGQTIRADIAQKEFPDVKSTYYALLVSMINLGQSFSSALGAWIFSALATVFEDFALLYLLVSIVAMVLLLLSFLVFKLIPVDQYEFAHHLERSAPEG